MPAIKVKIEIEDEWIEGDELGIEDAIADALRNLGYNVRIVIASQ